jgi:hypothetical protein
MIDVDKSNTIEKEETQKFWSDKYPNLNTNEMFSQVDKNNDGSIQLSEWLEFWTVVLHSGYNEKEILSDLDDLLKGESWVRYNNVDNAHLKQEEAIKHGKY